MLRTRTGAALAAALATAAGGAVAVATGAVGGSTTLKACVRAKDGLVRVPKSGTTCTRRERRITINTSTVRTGPAGKDGAAGAAGASGASGAAGPAGPQGPVGDPGAAATTPPPPPSPYDPGGNHFDIRIDGGPNLPLASLAGCDRPVITQPPRDCIVTLAKLAAPTRSWMHAALSGQIVTHDVDVLEANVSAVRGIHLEDARISDVRIADLVGAVADDLQITLTLSPQAITPLASPASAGGATLIDQSSNNFRVDAPPLTTTHITAVRNLHVKIPAGGVPAADPVALVTANANNATLTSLQGWSDDGSAHDLTIALMNASFTVTNLTISVPGARATGALTPFAPRTMSLAGTGFGVS